MGKEKARVFQKPSVELLKLALPKFNEKEDYYYDENYLVLECGGESCWDINLEELATNVVEVVMRDYGLVLDNHCTVGGAWMAFIDGIEGADNAYSTLGERRFEVVFKVADKLLSTEDGDQPNAKYLSRTELAKVQKYYEDGGLVQNSVDYFFKKDHPAYNSRPNFDFEFNKIAGVRYWIVGEAN